MSISAAEFDYIRGLVEQRSAIVLDLGKEYLAEQRLSTLARREGFPSLGELVRQLRSQPDSGLHRQVVEAMTTNETTFFRDMNPFEAMRKVVLPELAKRGGRVHLWSAACSTGQEPYSLAMLLREHFPGMSDTSIMATDLSREVLDKAREGLYGQLEINRGLPAPMLIKYFKRDGLHWRIDRSLTRMIDFREMNLVAPWPPMPPLDVVFLRNVLIYFNVETKKQILKNVRRALRPGGVLFLGGAETTLNLDDAFQRVAFERSSFYRNPG